ncbi:hypothetical protein LOZ53_006212 [Ophidiomyces ophidiicola]|nr:hypothetical protein LOZ55_005955 [Ophidiomyces ophidiicola]KAI1981505.1 hypothetical protein LOZ54_005572 [Ophidiomyces ophidiicola]KAI1982685.1 hypothetical protein LOZ53_006212 [Ophidiomyces ophidiicola]KAI1983683.1 hypothetical protein LOZ51_006841 [Ophidiomyces ophidiicola]
MSISASSSYPAHTQGSPTPLPPEKVFPIQIGSELFRLSGASIASDAPSYFSQFFEEQLRQNGDNSTDIIFDRETIRTSLSFLRMLNFIVVGSSGKWTLMSSNNLTAVSVPRLISQLFECEIFIQIGDRHFQIPRDIFSNPGDSPNFFSLGFAVFFATPGEVFPGLERQGLLRPPAITPPIVSNRSGEVFAELLHMLRGYPIQIRNEQHRVELLRDCRYFHLRGLEQKLIPHEISYNLKHDRSEILIRLEDIRPSGIQLAFDGSSPSLSGDSGGWVQYARPFVDDDHYELIVEIGGENTRVDLESKRAEFYGTTKTRVSSLLQLISSKTTIPRKTSEQLQNGGSINSPSTTPRGSPMSSGGVTILIDPDADIIVDGERYDSHDRPITGGTGACGPYDESLWATDFDETNCGTFPNLGVLPSDPDLTPQSFQREIKTGQPIFRPGSERERPQSPIGHPQLRHAQFGRPSRKRKRGESEGGRHTWIVRKGQWRLSLQGSSEAGAGGVEVVFVAVKLDVYAQQKSRNRRRGFLDSTGS